MIANTLEKIMQPINKAGGLSNEFYVSDERFKQERDTVFAPNWTALMFTSQLPANNHAKPVEFMGLPLLITNYNDEISVFHNVCRHRGHKLVEKEKPLTSAISCPYHSWTYKPSGELIGTPHIGGVNIHQVNGFDKKQYGLKKVAHGIFMNVLYINLNNQALPLQEYLKPVYDRWHEFLGDDGLQKMQKGATGGEWSITAQSNWKLAVENYCEAYHLPFVHPELNHYSPIDVHYNIEIGNNFSGQGTMNYSPSLAMVDGKEATMPSLKSWNTEKMKYGEYLSFYPNVLMGIQSDHAFSIILTPISPKETLEQLEIFYVGDGASNAKYEACRQETVNNWELVFKQDIPPIESMQKGRESSGFDGGVFSPALDVATHHFHKWIASQWMR